MKRTLLILALFLVAAAPARADVYDDNPATASRGPGETYVFARAADGAILERHWSGSVWTPWKSLGGFSTSGPAAVAFGGTIHVFMRGNDGAVYQSWLQSDDSWRPWISLGGYTRSAPAVTVRRGEGYLDLVVLGGDSQVYHRSYVPNVGWSAFATIGGTLTTAAAVNSQSPGLLNIWSRGTDGQMYQKSWNGTAWVDWSALGGNLVGAPTSISRAQDVINVYMRGVNNQTYQRGWTAAAGWTPDWFVLDPQTIDSAPAAGADSASHEYLFARHGADTLIYKEWNSTTGWGRWTDLGQIAVPPPPPPPGPPASAPIQDGQVNLKAGVACTPVNGKLRVSVSIGKPKGKARPRVTKIVFYTKGKGRRVRVDTKAPFQVHIGINRPAGSTGRVYARVYYKRTARGETHRKVVSRRYKVCR